MKNKIKKYVSEDNSIDVFTEINIARTSTGKYSYGNLCDHWLVKSVGSLSSIAPGTEVVPNHSIECNSIHPFLYWGSQNDEYFHIHIVIIMNFTSRMSYRKEELINLKELP